MVIHERNSTLHFSSFYVLDKAGFTTSLSTH
nr:MAG TPA_asm: hypothetical protein [Bacteriophage sp.]